MSKLSELWPSAPFRANSSRTSRKTCPALSLLFAAGALGASLHGAAAAPPLVGTQEGIVRGFIKNGVAEFLGIPYTAPPVGDLRWRPPKKHTAWAGVLKAEAFGSNCPQNQNHIFAGPANLVDEDCLFLNVFTPNLDPSARLPVIFWIHGGGNFEGESTDYDASKLASDGKTVVVTINYRLGSLGWLANPALDAEGHLFGNYGLLDTQFALKWVRSNIAKFGGDKNNVTVGGQSAGSFDVEGDLVPPLAAGLFQRAIMESLVTETQSLSAAEASGQTFADQANCNAANGYTTNAKVAKCLRSLSVLQVAALLPNRGSLIGDGTILPLQPTVVSPTQPGALYLAFQNGTYNHMPIMSGNVRDEANFGLAVSEYNSQHITTPGVPWLPGGPQIPYSAAQYAAAISTYPTTVTPFTAPLTVQAYVSAHYPLISPTPPGPQLSDNALSSDRSICPQHRINRVIASGPSPSPVYGYEFVDQTAPFFPSPRPIRNFGVSHGGHPIPVPRLPWGPGAAERQHYA